MHLVKTGPHRIAVNAFDRDDGGVRARPYPPHMEVSDTRVAGPFDELTDLFFQVVFMGVEQDAGSVAHERPRPNCDDRRANQTHNGV